MRHAGQIHVAPAVMAQQVETFADGGQHAERQHIDLHQSQRFEIILVPFDEGAIGHRRIVDRDNLLERGFAEHKTADMLRQMAGVFEQSLDHVAQPGEFGIGGIESHLG
jgi:hypothetical protein